MKAKIRLNTLRQKIVLSIVIVIALCAVISTFIINLVVGFQMDSRYRTEKEAAVESLSFSLRPGLESQDYQQLNQVISSYLVFENIASVAVFDNNGTPVGSESKNAAAAGEIQKESHEITNNGKTAGSFEIGFSHQYIDDFVARTTLILVIPLAVFIFLAGLALFVFVGRSVIRPLEVLAGSIKKIRPDNLSIRMDVKTDDEIGTLAANFNQMAGDLEMAIENARLFRESRDMAILEERNRMAREIHDTLAQGFTGIILQLEAAEQALPEDLNQSQGHIVRARKLARESLNQARRSVWALRPQELERVSLTAALRQQIQRFSEDAGIPAVFNGPPTEAVLPAEVENALLRICQEALANVKKHAGASRVEVKLSVDHKAARLKIDDNGSGFDPESPVESGFGLISMRERAKLLGGSMVIRSERGKGTHLEVTIPVERGAE